MTDPVTNVDMEGVLSSVRKLVSEGEGARTRDTAAAGTGGDATAGRASDGPDTARARDGDRSAKLVLTPAQRVTEGRSVAAGAPDTPADATPEASDRAAAPLVLERPIRTVQRTSGDGDPAPDAGGTDAASPAVGRDAEQGPEQPAGGAFGDAVAAEPSDHTVATPPDAKSPLTEEALPEDRATATASDDAGSRDPSGLEALDESALRALVAEIVREELQGALGDRITRNVRKLVRQEVYRHLSTREFD